MFCLFMTVCVTWLYDFVWFCLIFHYLWHVFVVFLLFTLMSLYSTDLCLKVLSLSSIFTFFFDEVSTSDLITFSFIYESFYRILFIFSLSSCTNFIINIFSSFEKIFLYFNKVLSDYLFYSFLLRNMYSIDGDLLFSFRYSPVFDLWY